MLYWDWDHWRGTYNTTTWNSMPYFSWSFYYKIKCISVALKCSFLCINSVVILDLSLFSRRREKGGIHWFGHTQKRSTPITKDAKDVCVCVFWVCAGVAGAAQCPWGNVHLLSSASALESPAVRSHSTSSPQRPALPAWEEGAVWEHGILGGAVFPLCRLRGGGWWACHSYCSITLSVWRSHTGSLQEKKARAKERWNSDRKRPEKRGKGKENGGVAKETWVCIFLCSIYVVPSREMNVPEN